MPRSTKRTQCSKCGAELEEKDRSYCGNCRRAYNRDRYQTSEKPRARLFKHQYGITVEEYERLLESQGGRCKICLSEPGEKRLAVDHCHQSRKVRGLLCQNCNIAIGLMDDSVERMEAAIRYLQANETVTPIA